MKRLFRLVLLLVCLIPITSFAKEKVKVYVFEAGGCPYCEAEIEYLEGLDSYNEKFTIVKKELYVDHVDWEKGADYDLGVKVANAFKNVGFEDASYQATPFVVISDLYAAAGYNTSLESYINSAYEKGDKDIVSCYKNGKTNCLDHLKTEEESSTSNSTNAGVIVSIFICTRCLITTYLIKSSSDTKKIVEALNNKKHNN